jgi:hypothetical protein
MPLHVQDVGLSRLLVWGMQASASCCLSSSEAASKQHPHCYRLLRWIHPSHPQELDVFLAMCLALRNGDMESARRAFVERAVKASRFLFFCVWNDEPIPLKFALEFAGDKDLKYLSCHAAFINSVGCLRLLLEYGAPWSPRRLLYAARANHLELLEVVLQHSSAWCPQLPTVAAWYGNVRFLMLIFDAGCPVWVSAKDGDLCQSTKQAGKFYCPTRNAVPAEVEDWTLLVSSDLVRSGPVLLYAARKGAPLTPRMQRMLGEVRRRPLALAGCFHRATRLSRMRSPCARKWDGMGRVPTDIVRRIATMARISIVEIDLVK